MAVNPDFVPYSGLDSLDVKLVAVSSISALNGATTPMSKAIPRQADSVVFVVGGPVAISLDGNAIAANPVDGAISLQTGWSPAIPLELDNDVTPQVFNGGAGAVTVTMLVFTKRRRLPRQRGQV